MAIDHTLLRMFLKLQERNAIKGRMLVIGVQDVMFSHEDLERFLDKENYKYKKIPIAERVYRKSKAQTLYQDIFRVENPMHMSDLFKMLNFTSVSSLDGFDSDNPTILHDLNQPIPDKHKEQFDAILDVGVMEHVFDIKQFVQTCIDLLDNNGHLILFDALSGFHNECMYNFQPPFYFDVFQANGFDNMSLYLNYMPKYHDFGASKTTWVRFEYDDRAKFTKFGYCTYGLFIGRKAKSVPKFVVPMQRYYSEYYQDWNSAEEKPVATEASHFMLENMPNFVRRSFSLLAPIFLMLPTFLRTPIVDGLMYWKNRRELASRERIRC